MEPHILLYPYPLIKAFELNFTLVLGFINALLINLVLTIAVILVAPKIY